MKYTMDWWEGVVDLFTMVKRLNKKFGHPDMTTVWEFCRAMDELDNRAKEAEENEKRTQGQLEE